MVEKGKSRLAGRTLFVPQMSHEGAATFAAACRSVGVDAVPSPDSDERTMALGARYTSGDECYPAKVTLGSFLKALEDHGPSRVAFFMPTATGPCRFGQYAPYLRKVLREIGHPDVPVISPTSSNGYEGIGDQSAGLMRTSWRALVASDILRKMTLKTRPYEVHRGDTDQVMATSLDEVCSALERQGVGHGDRMKALVASLTRARDRFRRIPAKYDPERLLIGVVGEIFCRLDTFSNEEMIRRIEKHGGEGWISDVGEWILYTNEGQFERLRSTGRRFSKDMLLAKIRSHIQRSDEHALYGPFKEDLVGYEEPGDIRTILDYSEPYLPPRGSHGEMVLSVGKAVYLYEKGADGIVDISPFTCMNGIICEAVYPRVSTDHEDIPIRNFYFDQAQSDLDRDVGIFVELAGNYKRRKRKTRRYPFCFKEQAAA